MFVDKICVAQQDPKLMSEGVVNIGGIVKNSKSMLVCWDSTYLSRLWCVLEVAAFLKTHDAAEKNLYIRPTSWGSVTCMLFLIFSVLRTGEDLVTNLLIPTQSWAHMDQGEFFANTLLFQFGSAIVKVPLTMLLAHVWRGHLRALESAFSQLSDFSFERDIRCHCCSLNHINPTTGRRMVCDHDTIRECLCTWFGSVADFEEVMRCRVSEVFQKHLKRHALPYHWILGITCVNCWGLLATIPPTIYFGDGLSAAVTMLLTLGFWLAVQPVLLLVQLKFAYLLRRCHGRCEEFLKNLAVALIAVTLDIAIAMGETALLFLIGELWLSSLVFVLIFAIIAVVMFCCC